MGERMTMLEAWRERGREIGGRGRSVWVSLSGLVAGAIVVVQLFGTHAVIGAGEQDADAGVRETVILAQKQGARPELLERKVREMTVLRVEETRRQNLVTAYANALVRARDLTREAGLSYASDGEISAAADALVAGNTDENIRWILEKAESSRRVVALSRYYILVRRGERSSSAAAMALRD